MDTSNNPLLVGAGFLTEEVPEQFIYRVFGNNPLLVGAGFLTALEVLDKHGFLQVTIPF